MKDILNQRFERFVVIKFDAFKGKKAYWICQCDCGVIKSVRAEHLIYGKIKSCGCRSRDLTAERNRRNATHGMSKTKEFRAWENMKRRCLNPNAHNYYLYGGRGITVCDRWLEPEKGFINFYTDLGPAPKGYSLDRIDVYGNYEPSNCRWATAKEQMRNRRVSSKSENLDDHMFWRGRLISGISRAVDQDFKNSFVEKYLGCTVQYFKQYIESLFLPGMTWDNHGPNRLGQKLWQFDHIKGCREFDLSKEEDRLKCFNYKNFQPLWWEDNQAKLKKDILLYA